MAGQRLDVGQEPATVGVLEVEDHIQRPVKVEGEPGRLPEQLLG
jgi:hypothetical protein